ncbi:Ldh family oxidoreductase [Schumannella luteola]|uniref:LDH2 family malate/lactate/ureidoglycolate dehydrogenase n=1 Tax=Schumannella luteola TaxID=472059 RepID=A0A852YAA6_9MICO|nr:Ldh family oxidoreductase [Schumannella luteola]NYG98792.1 LDH2 family malate/lactate/ureidoglycolate dehydrogenase [Schumannella luteola]TPW91070.1 Ldh family oxidoreductase [Schumannella luteola]
MTETTTDPAAKHEDDTVLVDAAELQRFAEQVLGAIGARPDDARDMATQIVTSELSGHESHGLRRLPEYVARVQSGATDPAATTEIEIDRGSVVRLHSARGFGHLALRDATTVAIDRARRHGIAGVALHGSDYAGRLIDFAEQAAEAGVALLVFTNNSGSGQVVAPPGATEGRLSTNPIAFGIPRAQAPHLVIDLATSAVAMGRVSEWRDRGETIPEEWASGDVLHPFGGAKGFALSLVAEALAGSLTGAGTVSDGPGADGQGVFLVAIDVAAMRPLAEFTADLDAAAAHITSAPVAEGAAPVRLPGEGSFATAERRRAEGTPLQRFTWDEMGRLAELCGVAPLSPRA